MVNFNGTILENNALFLNETNRGLKYGDAVFETIRVVNSKIYFWEEHYLRLMASMRILRMDIPMNFTMEFLQEEIISTITSNKLLENAVRVRFTVFRDSEGLYQPVTNKISYIIEVSSLQNSFYTLTENRYEVELFKDHYVNSGLLSTLKTNNKVVNVLAGIFAKENEYQNCLLINEQKNVIEGISGNLFLIKGKTIKTPPITDGCLNGILRKKMLEILKNFPDYEVQEASVSPFELQKADELFLTNVIQGIQPITKYRKKSYRTDISKQLVGRLNAFVRLL
ncbi:aminotransferase class IV [Zhouia sp. PK063]|uniref:aminotransferase class IV n=1 Tax=Zhouia sp. PK063 TaxID=3373602 RepID=UPI0037AA0F6D